MKLTITTQTPSVVSIHHQPNHFLTLLGLVVSLLLTVMFLIMKSSLAFYLLPVLGLAGFFVLTQYELLCVFNKNLGTIFYKQGGILGTALGERTTEHSMSEIEGLEMVRHVRRGEDAFQIRLVLRHGQGLYLSAPNLTFSECHTFAEQIRTELGLAAPPKAIG